MLPPPAMHAKEEAGVTAAFQLRMTPRQAWRALTIGIQQPEPEPKRKDKEQ